MMKDGLARICALETRYAVSFEKEIIDNNNLLNKKFISEIRDNGLWLIESSHGRRFFNVPNSSHMKIEMVRSAEDKNELFGMSDTMFVVHDDSQIQIMMPEEKDRKPVRSVGLVRNSKEVHLSKFASYENFMTIIIPEDSFMKLQLSGLRYSFTYDKYDDKIHVVRNDSGHHFQKVGKKYALNIRKSELNGIDHIPLFGLSTVSAKKEGDDIVFCLPKEMNPIREKAKSVKKNVINAVQPVSSVFSLDDVKSALSALNTFKTNNENVSFSVNENGIIEMIVKFS